MILKKAFILILGMVISTLSFAQDVAVKSDVRIKIDSIIKYEIQYVIDSTTNVIPTYKWDNTKPKGIGPCFSSLPPNPMTMIILEGKKVDIEELDEYQLENVESIKTFSLNNSMAMALYGESAKNGLVVIMLKK